MLKEREIGRHRLVLDIAGILKDKDLKERFVRETLDKQRNIFGVLGKMMEELQVYYDSPDGLEWEVLEVFSQQKRQLDYALEHAFYKKEYANHVVSTEPLTPEVGILKNIVGVGEEGIMHYEIAHLDPAIFTDWQGKSLGEHVKDVPLVHGDEARQVRLSDKLWDTDYAEMGLRNKWRTGNASQATPIEKELGVIFDLAYYENPEQSSLYYDAVRGLFEDIDLKTYKGVIFGKHDDAHAISMWLADAIIHQKFARFMDELDTAAQKMDEVYLVNPNAGRNCCVLKIEYSRIKPGEKTEQDNRELMLTVNTAN